MAEIAWTNEAKSWLQQIYDYIARDNEEAAWQVITGIYERVQILRNFPESGHRYQKYPDRNIRILLYGHNSRTRCRADGFQDSAGGALSAVSFQRSAFGVIFVPSLRNAEKVQK